MLITNDKATFENMVKEIFQENIRALGSDKTIASDSLEALDYIFVFKRYTARQAAQKEFKENLEMLKKATSPVDYKDLVNEKNSLLHDPHGKT